MVSRMLFILASLLFVMQTALAGQAESGLTIRVSQSKMEYGKPFYLDLQTRHGHPSLAGIDFSKLDEQFAINHIGDIKRDEKNVKQSLRLRLYPRRTGKIVIPSLAYGRYRTGEIPLTVTAALDPKNGSVINVNSTVSQTSVWLRQVVSVRMVLETRADILALASDEPDSPALEITALPVQATAITDKLSRHAMGWDIYPVTSGRHEIQLPPVKYIRDGVTTHLFYPPKLRLSVKSLPAYIPANMPAGQFELELSVANSWLLVKNELSYLSLRFGHAGRERSRLIASLTRQLQTNRDFNFYPPEEIDGQYRIPFAVKSTGLFSLPELRLQYFNHQSGRIQTRQYALDQFLVLGQWLVYFLYLVLFAAVSLLLVYLYHKLTRRWFMMRAYLQAACHLQLADSASACKTALMTIAGAESWSTNLSLQRWQEYWLRHFPRLDAVTAYIQHLEEDLYSNKTAADIVAIRAGLLEIIYQRLPLLRPLVWITSAAKTST